MRPKRCTKRRKLTDLTGESAAGAAAKDQEGALRMGLCVRLVRGLALSCVVLGGILVGAVCGTVASSGVAVAQTVNSIVVEGNRRVEADTIRSYFKTGPGGRLGPAVSQSQAARETASRPGTNS